MSSTNTYFKSGRQYACVGKRICNTSSKTGAEKNPNIFSSNPSTYMATKPFIYAQQVTSTSSQHSTSHNFSTKTLNAYGKWEGASGGAGKSLTNTY